MKTIIGQQVFIIKFRYPTPSEGESRTTMCYIRSGVSGERELSDYLITTIAKTHHKDNFNRHVGRMITFKRLMDQLFDEKNGFVSKFGLTKEHKSVFWKDFREQCPRTFKNI